MGVLKSGGVLTLGLGALGFAKHLAENAIPTSISQVIPYFSNAINGVLQNTSSIIGASAPFALPGYALYRGYKKYKEKGLWHGIEAGTLNYGILAAILTASGIFSAPFATVLATGVAMKGARAIWDSKFPEAISNLVSRGTDSIGNVIDKAEDIIAKGPGKIRKAVTDSVKWGWNKIFPPATPTPQPATA